MDETNIILAGQAFTVYPLTLRQIRSLRVAVSVQPSGDAQKDAAADMDRSVGIIAAALPQFTVDQLYDMAITPSELVAAVNAVLDVSGLIPKKTAPAGENAAAE